MLFDTSPKQNKLNLICLPYAGGNANFYRRWSKHLTDYAVIHPLHLPGRGNNIKSPLISDMQSLADLIINELYIFRNTRFAFIGTSMGGWIAYYVAQKLLQIESNIAPEFLILCSTASPEHSKILPDLNGATTEVVLSRLQTFNPSCMKTLLYPELASLFIPILQADFKLCQDWQFDESPKLNCPIIAFHGTRDNLINEHMMYRWRKLTNKNFSFIQITGDHFFTETPTDEFFVYLNNLLKEYYHSNFEF